VLEDGTEASASILDVPDVSDVPYVFVPSTIDTEETEEL
jgi:hypothetical protein